ncbi:MAG TPA: sigma-70 family RNA polymerase sigma factor [Polyangiaceae bacterium]|nr:sigma-70 family RNA polymerase sigma factor [Polyangiaceae bacterium]
MGATIASPSLDVGVSKALLRPFLPAWPASSRDSEAPATATDSPPRHRLTRVAPVAKREPDPLVLRAQSGDAQAFAELFRKHRSVVAAIAYRMLGPNADLEDVVQEVFLQVHRSLPDFRNQAKFSTWLHRVTVNVVLMTRRRAKSRPTYVHEDAARHEPATAPSPDHSVSRARRIEAFHGLLDKLSEKKRTVFVLHELEGMAPADIADVVDCPVLTVRTRLFYARKELAQMMRNDPHLAALAEETTKKDSPDEASGGTRGKRKRVARIKRNDEERERSKDGSS